MTDSPTRLRDGDEQEKPDVAADAVPAERRARAADDEMSVVLALCAEPPPDAPGDDAAELALAKQRELDKIVAFGVVRVVPRSNATTRILSTRWVT